MIEKIDVLRKTIYDLMDTNSYDQAKEVLIAHLEKYNRENDNNPFLLAEIAGFLIDIGSENWDADAAQRGTDLLENNFEIFHGKINEESYYYTLGNGREALYKIKNHGPGLRAIEVMKPDLITAKNYLHRAYKKIDLKSDLPFSIKVLSNLAGNLGQAGRVIDAIKLYQTILRTHPEFPQALIGLAENLDYWSLISSCPRTKAFYSIVYQNYAQGIAKGNIPPIIKEGISGNFKKYAYSIKRLDIDTSQLTKELKETENEYYQHNAYRKFCIDNYLSLNEHAVYCPCRAAAKDDLGIGHEFIAFTNDKVPKLELMLNRLKAEFGLARKLLYESENESKENDIMYHEVGDNEMINESGEKLRTSFKICFGILDKIAHGICFFYNLKDNPKEPIYFNNFWETKQSRWEKIKQMRNPHLLALYSIANDLNTKEGEFGFYKEWRNALEHNLLILRRSNLDIDPLKIFSEPKFVQKVSYDYFREQALYLLQICRSAIFSFTYCIRMETLEEIPTNGESYYLIKPKQ